MSEKAISLEGVSKSFGDKEVLKEVDLTVPAGTILGLVGKNGAGKTTLIKCLLGLLRPDSGTTRVYSDDSWNLSNKTRARIGYVPQVLTGFRWMKVRTMLEYTGSFYTHWNEKKVDNLVSDWELDSETKIGTLSVGERQKLAIILAMGHEPDLYVLDEPVASLDPIARRKFIKQLIELNISEGKTMLFSSHITSDLERVAADIALLKDGRIMFKCDLAELKDRVRRIHLQARHDLPDPLPLPKVVSSKVSRTAATAIVDGLTDEEIRGLGSILEAQITIEQMNLEEIFLELNK